MNGLPRDLRGESTPPPPLAGGMGGRMADRGSRSVQYSYDSTSGCSEATSGWDYDTVLALATLLCAAEARNGLQSLMEHGVVVTHKGCCWISKCTYHVGWPLARYGLTECPPWGDGGGGDGGGGGGVAGDEGCSLMDLMFAPSCDTHPTEPCCWDGGLEPLDEYGQSFDAEEADYDPSKEP